MGFRWITCLSVVYTGYKNPLHGPTVYYCCGALCYCNSPYYQEVRSYQWRPYHHGTGGKRIWKLWQWPYIYEVDSWSLERQRYWSPILHSWRSYSLYAWSRNTSRCSHRSWPGCFKGRIRWSPESISRCQCILFRALSRMAYSLAWKLATPVYRKDYNGCEMAAW